MRKLVEEAVRAMQVSATDFEDAVEAAYTAFHGAACLAGNGMGSNAVGFKGSFYANADINSGELTLYFNVEDL